MKGLRRTSISSPSLARLLGFACLAIRPAIAVYDPLGEIVATPQEPYDAALQGLRGDGAASDTATYIVTFSQSAGEVGTNEVKAQGVAAALKGEVGSVYEKVLNGFSVTIPRSAEAELRAIPFVDEVEEDGRVHALAASWGLDRVAQCAADPLDRETFSKQIASDVDVYIVDTGVLRTHEDLAPFMTEDCHATFTGEGTGYVPDGNGHGTHVASIAAGVRYGVSEPNRICAVKVLGNRGGGSYSGVISGIEFVVEQCGNGKAKCVANMSLGGGRSSTVNRAVKNAVDAGVVMVVAAGNSNEDACNSSPSSELSAITVGATERSGGNDVRATFTNYGACVDVSAPGRNIEAAWIGSDSDTRTISGTSMASPHVAGLAAKLLHEGVDAGEVRDRLARADRVSVLNVDCKNEWAGASVGIATIGGLGCDDANVCESPACDDAGERCWEDAECCEGAQDCAGGWVFFGRRWTQGRCRD